MSYEFMRLVSAALCTVGFAAPAAAAPESVKTRIGTLEFTHDFANGYPSDATVRKLYDELDFQRACQSYIWSLPLVSFAEWQKAHETTFGTKSGDVVVYDTMTTTWPSRAS
jgi:hypothetical protein